MKAGKLIRFEGRVYYHLESVGSLIDANSGLIFPCNIDETPDLHAGGATYVRPSDDDLDDFDKALSDRDIGVIEEINRINLAERSRFRSPMGDR